MITYTVSTNVRDDLKYTHIICTIQGLFEECEIVEACLCAAYKAATVGYIFYTRTVPVMQEDTDFSSCTKTCKGYFRVSIKHEEME